MRVIGVSVWVVDELDEEGGGVGDLVDREEASTSSLRIRPSLPVPVTSDVSIPWSFRRPRTAGVASELRLLLAEGFGTSCGSGSWSSSDWCFLAAFRGC